MASKLFVAVVLLACLMAVLWNTAESSAIPSYSYVKVAGGTPYGYYGYHYSVPTYRYRYAYPAATYRYAYPAATYRYAYPAAYNYGTYLNSGYYYSKPGYYAGKSW